MVDDERAPAKSEKGKEILAYAFNEGDCVLEFQEQPDGTVTVMDITEHVRQLEAFVLEDDN